MRTLIDIDVMSALPYGDKRAQKEGAVQVSRDLSKLGPVSRCQR